MSLAILAFANLRDDARRALDATDTVLGFEGLTGAALLAALDPIRQAGFLNIIAKSAVTVFANGKSVGSYLEKLLELRGDRFFVTVPHELREETKNSAMASALTRAPRAEAAGNGVRSRRQAPNTRCA